MSAALDAAARVPTARGWRELGELCVGDDVFGADGLPVKVAAVREVEVPGDEAIELRLCDGSALACGASQAWLVERGGADELLETCEMARLLRLQVPPRISLPLPAPLERRYGELPSDPYSEGARLGSGLLDEACGISRPYLEGDVIQRRELLMGLLDEGGGVTSSGAVHFDTVHSHLVRDVCELVRSLGHRATISSGGGSRGRYGRVSFTTDEAVFGLRSPAELLLERAGHLAGRRILVDAVEVGWRPMVTVEVEGESHLFVCGDGLQIAPDAVLSAAALPPARLRMKQHEEVIG